MARATATLSVFAFLLVGAGVVGVTGDEPTVLLALLGTALCALGCVGALRTVVTATPAVVVPGRRTRHAAAGATRQQHPDTAGRPRPRAPGRTLPAT